MKREIRIVVDEPTGWDPDDFEYLYDRIQYLLKSELYAASYTIEEIKK